MAIWDDYKWNIWLPDEEPLKCLTSADKYYRISICTTCMNRTYDLVKTLPLNILDNFTYPRVEFVVLNYNSQDDLDDFMRERMQPYMDLGILKYAKTVEPQFYDMGHSRNVAFKIASGEIVNNVDADNFIGKGFVETLNQLAHMRPEKAVFAKGKRMLHGRLGMYKKEFIELGGYDEDLDGYGADDASLLYRAMALDYKLMWWSDLGRFSDRIKTSRRDKVANMENKNWKQTEEANKAINFKKLEDGVRVVNQDRHWGKAKLVINFKEEVEV
jgi:hypothetical protein